MAGTMGGMYVGVTGLMASHNALNTTAHNLANVKTTGYSRQQVLQSDLTYNKLGVNAISVNQKGLGTRVSSTRQVRDKYLDIEYRKEFSRCKYYQAKYDTFAEVENYFGETEKTSFQLTMNKFWTSISELQKEPNSIVARNSLIANASALIENATHIYNQMSDYQMDLNTQVEDSVTKINKLAQKIFDLGINIVKAEASGSESANDMRDARNQALDELAGIIDIEVREDEIGYIDVYAEDHLLVTVDRTFELGTKPISDSNRLLTVYWKVDGTETYHLSRIPNTDEGTDVGSLKGILMARGGLSTNYTDIPIKPFESKPIPGQFATNEEYQNALALWHDYEDKLNTYNTYIEPCAIPNIMAQFDQLIHGITTKVNDILCPNTTITAMDGTKYTILDEDAAGIGMGNGNEFPGTELFVRKGYSRYEKQTISVDDGFGNPVNKTVYVYKEEDPSDNYSLYTLGELQVNDALLKNPSLLPLSTKDKGENQKVVDQMLQAWSDEFAALNPNTLVKNNFSNYYADMIGDFADKAFTCDSIATSQEIMTNEINNQRQEVVGTSSDEELTNLIKFQQAYNASSRYVTAVAEMIEHIIERLGA